MFVSHAVALPYHIIKSGMLYLIHFYSLFCVESDLKQCVLQALIYISRLTDPVGRPKIITVFMINIDDAVNKFLELKDKR